MAGTRLTLPALSALCVVVATTSMAANVQPSDNPRHRTPPSATERLTPVHAGAPRSIAEAVERFLERHGGTWTFMTDPRTERVAFAQGSGVALVSAGGRFAMKLEDLVDPVRAFVDEQRALIGSPVGDLVLNRDRSSVRGRLASLYFDWQLAGVPVEGALVFVRLNSGRITQFGSRWVGGVEIFPAAEIDAEQARAAVLAYSGDGEVARFLRDPALLVTPVDNGTGLDYRMVWRMSYRVPGRHETWEGRVDARTGTVIGFRDTNVYARASGGVFPRSVWLRNETPAPFPFLKVTVDGQVHYADAAGRFEYTGGDVRAGLNSRHLQTYCAECSEPEQPTAGAPIGTGSVDFGMFGGEGTGNGFSTPAGRNVYYHLHQVRRVARKWLPTMRWLRREGLTSNVNIDAACNAFYSQEEASINFFRSGNGCNNTGMIADVIHHEWGHAIDFATLLGDGATGEGTADVVAMHMTRSPAIAPGFRVDGRPIRDLNSATNELGLMTWSRIRAGVCDFPTGGASIHCIGTVYGQAAWDLAQALISRHGRYTGWRVSERLFYQSLPDAGSLDPESALAIYPAYLQADDDDGNLANGTPNADLIYAAFATHGIAQAPIARSATQTAPAQPDVEATPRCARIELVWEPVEGAERYEVLRTELVSTGPLFPVATRTAEFGEYVDRAVMPGLDYRYVVMAVDATETESTVEPGPPVHLTEQPVLSVVAVDVSDTPRGNRSGFWDPGETLDIVLTLANSGAVPATNVGGRIEPITPGVTTIEDFVTWPDMAPGEQSPADRPVVVRIDADVACGATLEFRVVPDEATGCAAAEPSWFPVQVGAPDERFGFVCDDTPACFVEPEFAGLELATPAGCGEIRLRWMPAESQCADADVRYDVFRGDSPDFTPGPATRIATGLSATSWTDRLLVPDTVQHYVVRAVDSRSGADDNARVVTAIAPAGLDDQPPLFTTSLDAESGENCAETELRWEPARESCSVPVTYRLFRSTEAGFTPGSATLVAATLNPEFTDTAPEAGVAYHYVVQAVDDVGNVAPAEPRGSARARVFDRELIRTGFDPTEGDWRTIEPNDAERGNWDWGDPEGTDFQPENDASPNGARCWMTGTARMAADGNNNDVDFGTTTLVSPRYDIAGTVDPVVRYSRWFTNDRATNPADPRDTLRVHVSADDGISWTLLEEVGGGTPLAWVPVELPLAGVVAATDRLRLRFTASDIGMSIDDASVVEAGIDEFSIVDRGQGCATCDPTTQPVTAVIVSHRGDDVVLDWAAGHPAGTRFTVEIVSGSRLDSSTPVGTATTNHFVHTGAALSRTSYRYHVSAIVHCGD